MAKKKRKISIDIETSKPIGVHDMIIMDHQTGKSTIVDIKCKPQSDMYSHIADAMRYGKSVMMYSGRQMGKSLALGMGYGAGVSTWRQMQQLYEEMQQEKLAKSSELGSILYGKD